MTSNAVYNWVQIQNNCLNFKESNFVFLIMVVKKIIFMKEVEIFHTKFRSDKMNGTEHLENPGIEGG